MEPGNPPTFGEICSGECEIFLCENGERGRFGLALGPDFGAIGFRLRLE